MGHDGVYACQAVHCGILSCSLAALAMLLPSDAGPRRLAHKKRQTWLQSSTQLTTLRN